MGRGGATGRAESRLKNRSVTFSLFREAAMAREFRVLHHRQSGGTGGHWDLVENPIPFRASSAQAPHGEGSLCSALQHLAEEGWVPVLDLAQPGAQSGESFLLLTRG
jgi:hypothetical protein